MIMAADGLWLQNDYGCRMIMAACLGGVAGMAERPGGAVACHPVGGGDLAVMTAHVAAVGDVAAARRRRIRQGIRACMHARICICSSSKQEQEEEQLLLQQAACCMQQQHAMHNLEEQEEETIGSCPWCNTSKLNQNTVLF